MAILTPGALIGIVLGALAFGGLSDRAVKALIGATAVAFISQAALRSRLVGAADAPAGEASARGLFRSERAVRLHLDARPCRRLALAAQD
jgi:uncharacterized membrane protein YfcA